ncbi:TPA: hypothetical protein NBT51_003493 [Vibrio parahaemolyticus]|nr:hypothetical protein [Vibrio parahaemolyticus]
MEHNNDSIQQTVNAFTLFYTALSTIEGMSCHAVLLLSHLLKLLHLNKPEQNQITFGAMDAFNQLGLSQSEYKTGKRRLKELGIVNVQSNSIGLRSTIEVKLDEIATLSGIESADIDVLLVELKNKPNPSEMSGVIRFFPSLVIDHNFSITEALIFNQLKYRSDYKRTVMYSSTRLAKELACGKTKISNARQSLINRGLIAIVQYGIGNHIVYELTAKGSSISTQVLSSVPKPPADKLQDESTDNKVKNNPLPEAKISTPEVKNSSHPVKINQQSSQNKTSIKRDQIDKKNLGKSSQFVPPTYCQSQEYSAQELLVFMKRKCWTDAQLGHMSDSEVRTFSVFLETTNGLPVRDKKNLNEWLTSFNRSQRFNRSRAALSLGSTSS